MASYAIVNDRGRRYTVRPGEEILIDLRKGAEPGSKITLDQVELLSGDAGVQVGAPLVKGAKVVGVVKGEHKGEKRIVFVYKRRKSSRRKHGSRPRYTRVAIQSIEGA
ncbi:MAG TPA: 50S ribosomal protein L21 [Planctomycetota bacterium]|nr:50S ribosomal protein L21 [Planctomycetota bacterium]